MKKIVYWHFILMLIACSSGGGDNPTEEQVNNPEKATLVFPNNNSECFEGQIIDANTSKVTFTWNKANYANNYVLSLKNLKTQSVKTHKTNNTSLDINIDRATPYSWFVTSQSNKTSATAKSEIWKFYNAGEGTANHVPFPAEAVNPLTASEVTAQNGTVSLKWSGNDIDNDIESYTIYFGTSSTPNLYQSDVKTNELNNVSVEPGKTYYWKVKTIDSEGNTSMSDVFGFKVK